MSNEIEELNWYEIDKNAKIFVKGPPYWPKNVAGLSIDGMSFFGIDELKNLYWDGKQIETIHPIKLSGLERVLAIAVAFSSITVAAVEVIKLLKGLP